jgi:hypothetical protein
LNQNNIDWQHNIITDSVCEEMYQCIHSETPVGNVIELFHEKSKQYNMDQKNIMIMYFNYLIRSHPEILTHDLLEMIKNAIHIQSADIMSTLKYVVYNSRHSNMAA